MKEKATIPSVFNHTSVIGDEVKISYTVRLKISTCSLNHFLLGPPDYHVVNRGEKRGPVKENYVFVIVANRKHWSKLCQN